MCFRRLIFMILFLGFAPLNAKQCTGHFLNPVTDVCWRCLFPLSIGNAKVVSSSLPDTENASSPIGVCPASTGVRIGLNIGFWEPMALTDVTDTPYCLVNLGGTKLNLGLKQGRGGRHVVGNGQQRAFFHVHWYKYPLINWLNLITSVGCLQKGDFDIAYLTELDPTWQDSEMSFVLSPESVLFGNPVAAGACAADALSSTMTNKPLDSLFWCAGSQGTHYPMTGHVNASVSPVQTAMLLTERMNYKMHRELLVSDSSPKSGAICKEHYYSVTPKSRYRYEMVNQVADGKHCYPSGHSTLIWEAGKIKAHTPDQYGFLVWRKRHCTFL
ncbi:TPA: conjugal transfer pilus assembly protein TraU [Legionella pneumophila]|nr:conjugal transfer pilus assembly protein TraU [Legionella pneumophila]HBD7168464.1 conjugal transfer pilus assembly protein TraU [Legionella pneumophila]HBD7298199.1 conjugal transfer pilus assembly protein TraU [Legionella pneumophila]HBD7457077.1 conjugal transfer pilus assembly protein TraU [Legionella pneumophila]HCX3308503.1 conjugal transfer pilus assembly protein TraU [Legionella pneumophila]